MNRLDLEIIFSEKIVADRCIEAGPAAVGQTRIEEMTNLSEGGLYVRTVAPAPVNTLVPLTLIPGDREIVATAVVLFSSEKVGGMHAVAWMGMKVQSSRSEFKVPPIRAFRGQAPFGIGL